MHGNYEARRAALARRKRQDALKMIGIALAVLVFLAGCYYFTSQAAASCEAQGGVYEYDDGECEVDGRDLVEYD